MGEPITVARRWRVRLWIRIAVVLGLLLLTAEQADVVRRVGHGDRRILGADAGARH